METVIKFKEQLSTSQLKMAIDVLKAIGLNVIEDKSIVELNNEQKKILDFVEMQSNHFDEALSLLNKQIQKLKEYKTTLINDAVTGKIKVA